MRIYKMLFRYLYIFLISGSMYMNNYLISPLQTIDDEDIIIVEDRTYYDKFSFKNNWAETWKDSDIWWKIFLRKKINPTI